MMNFGYFGHMDSVFGIAAMIFRGLFSLGILVGLVLLIVWLARSLSGRRTTSNSSTAQPSAREILQMRYARGEISQDDYRAMLADINS